VASKKNLPAMGPKSDGVKGHKHLSPRKILKS